MNREQKETIIEMAKKMIIPNAMTALKDEVDKISIDTTQEEAKAIFEVIDDNHVTLIQKIDQLRSFFK